MTKKTRTILFYTLALIFIIVASIITLSAQGYKFDFEKMEFLQTGGIFVKVYPVGSQVYIDGEPEEKIPSFTRSVLVQNLLPGEYDVKIESKGYYSWEKSLTVEEQKVTDAKNIILFAQDMGFEALKEEIEESWFLNDKILYLKNESFFLYDLKENLEEEVFNVSEGEEFLNLILSKDKNSAIVKTSEGFYLVFLEEEKDPLILSFLNSEASGISLDQGYVTFQVLDQILVRDIEEIETVVLVEEDAEAFMDDGGCIYYLTSFGLVLKKEKENSNLEIISKELMDIKEGSDYSLYKVNDMILIEEDGIIYSLNEGLFEKFLDASYPLEYIVGSEKILFNTGHEFWILLLKDFYSPFFKEEGEKVFLSRYSDQLKNILWINGDYFMFVLNDTIKISEVDNRDRINTVDIEGFVDPLPYFSDNKIYVFSENTLFVSNQIIP